MDRIILDIDQMFIGPGVRLDSVATYGSPAMLMYNKLSEMIDGDSWSRFAQCVAETAQFDEPISSLSQVIELNRRHYND